MTCRLEPVTLTVDAAAILTYAALSNDYNPIHVDPEFAAGTPLGGVIAHGTLSLNLLLEAIERTLGRPAEPLTLDVRFRAPVRAGDVVEAGGERLSGELFAIWVRNQRGENVIEGEARVDTGKA